MSLLDDFEQELSAQKPSGSSTPRTYRWGAEQLVLFLDERGQRLSDIGPAVAHDFALWCRARQHPDGRLWSTHSQRTAINGALTFMRFCARRGLSPPVDLGKPPKPSPPKTHPVFLDDDELARYQHRATQEPEPLQTILQLLPLTGCRAKELCGAPIAGLGRTQHGILVICVRRKGSKLSFKDLDRFDQAACFSRLSLVPLSADAEVVVRAYLERHRRAIIGSPWLFPSTQHHGLFVSYQSLRKAVVRMREDLGLGWLVSHKAGRHTLAMNLKLRGATDQEIADALEASPDVIRRFYAQTGGEAGAELVRDTMDRAFRRGA